MDAYAARRLDEDLRSFLRITSSKTERLDWVATTLDSNRPVLV